MAQERFKLLGIKINLLHNVKLSDLLSFKNACQEVFMLLAFFGKVQHAMTVKMLMLITKQTVVEKGV